MRHAYLIIAHDNPDFLLAQFDVLKQKGCDFYYHLDKRMKFDCSLLLEKSGESKVYFIKSKKIVWGNFSQIDCELRLLEAAIKGNYDYYHLLSGVDMPIKPPGDINLFFENNYGKEFIHYDGGALTRGDYERVQLYHFFPGRSHIMRCINGFFVKLQRAWKINRLKKTNLILKKGANWFSITHDLASELIQNKNSIRKMYQHTFCGDEVFLQTFVYNSEYRDRVYLKGKPGDYHCNMRKIDWDRGTPYVFSIKDKEELSGSDFIFARKFKPDIDTIQMIEELCCIERT